MTDGPAPLFTTSRTFDAPRKLVWRVWTEQAHLGQWMSPAGMTQLSSSLDLRPGGVFHYGLRTPDGLEMWGKWVFREVTPTDFLEFVQSFSDAAGGLDRHPMAADWPLETLSTVAFSEEDGKTTVILSAQPVNASENERQTFAGAFGSMTQGWGGTFDKLETYLAATA